MLAGSGAVLIEGARGAGKTATAIHAARSVIALDTDRGAREAGLLDPRILLDGGRPRLIDEWQLVPSVWNEVRRAVDESGWAPGQFILTGSAVPPDDVTRHSGAGRIARLRLRTMSFAESGNSTGDVSLAALMNGEPARATDPGLTIRDIAELVSVGGWPGLQERSVEQALRTLRGYLAESARVDLRRVDGVERDPNRVSVVMASVARYTASMASARRIAADVGGADGPIKHQTVLDYLNALSRVFVVEDLAAWSPTLRGRTRLRGQAKRHFSDPSLAVAAMNANPDRLIFEADTLGLLFESLMVRDLRAYADGADARVLHYHDENGLEADAIVEYLDGRWGAFEAKLGHDEIDQAAAALLRLAGKMDPRHHRSPSTLAVITGWGYAYRRPDGVNVVPIGALSP